MRRYLRRKARNRMKKDGYTRINKAYAGRSPFAKHWREYC